MPSAAKTRRTANRAPLEAELVLEDWGLKGATVAQINERSVSIDRGVPGERVGVTVDRRRRQWRGVVNRVLDASPDRIDPSCPAYLAGCGGCQWQHMRYDSQLATKKLLVERELVREQVDISVSRVHSMSSPWRYRRTAAIALGWEAGFRPRARRGILEIRDCPISHPLIGSLANILNDLLPAGRIPPYHGKIWLDCTVVGAASSPELQIVIQGIEGLTLESHPELPDVARVLGECPSVASVSFRHRSGQVRPLVGPLESTMEVAGRAMWVPAGAFVQTNGEMLDRLIERMEPSFTARLPLHAADVYGGIGTFAMAFAAHVRQMTLVELDDSAVFAARRTAFDRGIQNVSYLAQHAERAMPALVDLDLAVVDPPRSGLGVAVTDALGGSSVRSIMYVSCSARSLARDLAALQRHGFRAVSLELFDFYPHTYHVECLTILDRDR